MWKTLGYMNAQEFKKWLASKGCTFESKKDGSGHLIVQHGGRSPNSPYMAAAENLLPG